MSDSSVLVQEPSGTATAEIDSEQISASGPQASKPLRRERMQLGGRALAAILDLLNADPVGSEYAVPTRPIFPASGINVSDRDARILGRAKLLDSFGNPIDPALKSQLPAALATDTPAIGDGGVIMRVVDNDRWATGSLNGALAAVTTDCQGKAGVGFTIGASTLVGTVVAEWSATTAGADWFNSSIFVHSSLSWVTGGVPNPASNSDYTILLPGAARRVRIKVSVFGSGAGPCTVVATNIVSPLALAPTIAINGVTTPLFHGAVSGIDGAGIARALLLKNADPLSTDFGQVTRLVGTIIPGTSATALGKAEDAVVGDGDVGVGSLAERFDNPVTAKTSADRDYILPSTDRAGVFWIRKRQLITYTAVYRLADATAGQLSLTFTFVANTNKQLATIYHTGASTKTVRIREAGLWIALGAAGTYNLEFRPLSATTAPATGNPAITPTPHNQVSAAAEATCLALPTTAGSLVNADRPLGIPVEWLAAAGAGPTNPAATFGQYLELYKHDDSSEEEPYVMRAGVAEGYAINGRCTAAVVGRFMLIIKFTEEA